MERRRRTQEEFREMRCEFYHDLEEGKLTIGQATRRMRRMVGLTQKEYAEKILKIYPRVLSDLENDRGNPTLETLEKVAKPFGLKIGFTRKTNL